MVIQGHRKTIVCILVDLYVSLSSIFSLMFCSVVDIFVFFLCILLLLLLFLFNLRDWISKTRSVATY